MELVKFKLCSRDIGLKTIPNRFGVIDNYEQILKMLDIQYNRLSENEIVVVILRDDDNILGVTNTYNEISSNIQNIEVEEQSLIDDSTLNIQELIANRKLVDLYKYSSKLFFDFFDTDNTFTVNNSNYNIVKIHKIHTDINDTYFDDVVDLIEYIDESIKCVISIDKNEDETEYKVIIPYIDDESNPESVRLIKKTKDDAYSENDINSIVITEETMPMMQLTDSLFELNEEDRLLFDSTF